MTEETFEPTLDADLFDEEIDAEVEEAVLSFLHK